MDKEKPREWTLYKRKPDRYGWEVAPPAGFCWPVTELEPESVHVIEKRVYLEAVEKYSALSLKHSDLVDKFVIQKQELNHKTEIVCGEENKTIKVEWAYVERRAYDELKLENERLKNHFDNCHAGKIITLSLQNNKQAELLTHLEQALEDIDSNIRKWKNSTTICGERFDLLWDIAKQALEKVKELKG